MRYTALLVVLAATTLSAFASNPGQPLDCSDWVFLEPGLSCSQFIRPGELTQDNPLVFKGLSKVVDNTGRLLFLREVPQLSNETSCPIVVQRLEIVARDTQGEFVLGYIQDREYPGDGRDHIRTWDPTDYNWSIGVWDSIAFDPNTGTLFIPVQTACTTSINCQCVVPYPAGSAGWSMIAITGFATMFEIFQSYTPSSGPISFRVPAIPEGLPAADYFDTYYGDLATVGDWSQAQSLQCGYPASPPSVGDYLEVEDPLPNPDPGRGRYYVTAVHYQGQTRYGRKSMGGVLSGRDPAVLPACGE